MSRSKLFALAALLATTSVPTALAQEGGAPDFLALGVAMSPDHPGSDDYRFLPFGAGRVTSGGVVYQVEGPGISAAFFNQNNVEAGVFGRWVGGRDDDIDDAVVGLLPERDGSPIGGGFVRVRLAEGILSPRDRLSLGARIGADITGEYGDLFWSSSLSYSAPISRSTQLIANLSISGSGDDYSDALFSVDAAGSAASGLASFSAEGGVESFGMTVFLDQALADNWSVTGVIGASVLQGDYADSPIVTERGDVNSYFAGVGLGRRF
ncbi:MAG: MipA/OmpV family protein [Maricaulis sp.]|nr:MipA/OmpV family protein [Maricaulis sp.]